MKKTAVSAGLLAVIIVLIGAFAPSASAHARLLKSTPKKGATVASLADVTLVFSDKLDPEFVKVQIRGSGKQHEMGAPEITDGTVTQKVSGELASGPYEIAYRVVSADGHRVEGEVPFEVKAKPDTATPTAPVQAASSPSAAATSDDSGSGGTRWLMIGAGLVLGFGIGGGMYFLRQGRKVAR